MSKYQEKSTAELKKLYGKAVSKRRDYNEKNWELLDRAKRGVFLGPFNFITLGAAITFDVARGQQEKKVDKITAELRRRGIEGY